MTRETYIKVAKAIKKQMKRAGTPEHRLRIIALARNFAGMAKNDNAKFDLTKFRQACGIVLPCEKENHETKI